VDRWHVVNKKKANVPAGQQHRPQSPKKAPPLGQQKGQGDSSKVNQTGEGGGLKPFNAAHKPDNPLHDWSDREIRFHAVGVRNPLTKEQWHPMATQLKAAHAIWSKVYTSQHEDWNTVKINNPMWDKIMGCGVITLPEGANAKKIRDGFIPQLQLPIQLRASVKEDMSVPVVRTIMPDELYAAFQTEEHLVQLRQWNPVFAANLFEQHKCYRQDKGRTLQIRTSEEVVKYLMEKNFVVQYPSGDVTFQREINWTAAKAVCTLLVEAKNPTGQPVGTKGSTGKKEVPIKASTSKAKEPENKLAPEDRSKKGNKASASKLAPEDRSGDKGRLGKDETNGGARSVRVLQRQDKVQKPPVVPTAQSGAGVAAQSDGQGDRFSNSQEFDQLMKEWDDLPVLEDQQEVQVEVQRMATEGSIQSVSARDRGATRDHDYGRQGGLQVLADAAAQVGADEQKEEGELPEEGEEVALMAGSQRPNATVYESAMGSDLDYEEDSEESVHSGMGGGWIGPTQ